jgi:hypothetical protein
MSDKLEIVGYLRTSSGRGSELRDNEEREFLSTTQKIEPFIRLSDHERSSAADKTRIDELESALGILTKAVKELRTATPSLHCDLFHHKRCDQHGSDQECPPFERWCVAAMAVTAALAQQEQQ